MMRLPFFCSNTASAAHLQYNSPLGLYSAKNAANALNTAIPGDSAAAQTIKYVIICDNHKIHSVKYCHVRQTYLRILRLAIIATVLLHSM